MADPTTPQQALEALERLADCGPVLGYELINNVIRPALEAAAKEQADWEAIEEWLGDDDEKDCHIGPSAMHPGAYTCRLVTTLRHGSVFCADDKGATRVEAIAAAAEWCRKEPANG